jgi:hypothetical protein
MAIFNNERRTDSYGYQDGKHARENGIAQRWGSDGRGLRPDNRHTIHYDLSYVEAYVRGYNSVGGK